MFVVTIVAQHKLNRRLSVVQNSLLHKFFTAYHAYFGMAIGDQDKFWALDDLLRDLGLTKSNAELLT